MSAHTLERTAFRTSRLLEFFSEKELRMQIGHPRRAWPIALLKELIDNALDACESAGIAPSIHVTIEPDAMTVEDNGPGLPLAVLRDSLDYLNRVSDKAHFVSPTRGQLGNALKCVWAAPYVWTGERGRVDVTTGGRLYRVDVTLDRIAQEPRLELTEHPAIVKSGTIIKVYWPGVAGLLKNPGSSVFYNDYPSVYSVVSQYPVFNPHAAFRLEIDGRSFVLPPTVLEWAKWLPTDPTSPHWYTPDRLRDLIGAYLKDERDGGKARTVREFVSEFRGLSGSTKPKAVTEAAKMSGAWLRDLIDGNEVSAARAGWLLAAMQAESRIVKPDALGVLGEAHLAEHLVDYEEVEAESIQYKKVAGLADGVPFVLEVAFGVFREGSPYGRSLTIGLNWTPALLSPLRELTALLGENRVDSRDPVAVIVHLACPRLDFTDRGKSALALPAEISEALQKAIQTTCKAWKAKKQQADRDGRVKQRDLDELRRANRARQWTIKDAAYHVMADAYNKASGGGRYPANARQIMYAARPGVLKLTGGAKIWKTSQQFTQGLLIDYLEEHLEETAAWDVVFDDRGHFAEPHTDKRLGLGTLAVRRYIARWHDDVNAVVDDVPMPVEVDTSGPGNRYRFALFVEKEGFNELLAAAEIAERYDIGLMSTKGMSNTSARRLVDRLSCAGVTTLVVHDFDKSGFEIMHTLSHDTRRYKFTKPPRVIDLGLSLADVEAMGLESEVVEYDSQKDPRLNLAEKGATPSECRFLVKGRNATGRWTGDRVELNAMPSDQFIAWLEGKLKAHGVTKVVPTRVALENAYRRAVQYAALQKIVDAALKDINIDDIAIPDDLEAAIRDKIDGTPAAWDDAIWELAREAATPPA